MNHNTLTETQEWGQCVRVPGRVRRFVARFVKRRVLSTRGRVELVLLTERVSIKRMLLLRLPSALPETCEHRDNLVAATDSITVYKLILSLLPLSSVSSHSSCIPCTFIRILACGHVVDGRLQVIAASFEARLSWLLESISTLP
jgi:hypothetical protein